MGIFYRMDIVTKPPNSLCKLLIVQHFLLEECFKKIRFILESVLKRITQESDIWEISWYCFLRIFYSLLLPHDLPLGIILQEDISISINS